MIIELYLKSDKGVISGDGHLPGLQIGGSASRRYQTYQSKETYIGYSDNEKELKEKLEQISNMYGIELRVYDISKMANVLKARSKNIKKTPTIIIDNKKFEGNIRISDIKKHIQSLDKRYAFNVQEKISGKYKCPRCQSANIKVFEDMSGHCNKCDYTFMEAASEK